MSPGSSTESYPAFAHIGLREYPGKNLNQVTCPDRESNPGHLVSRSDALAVTPQDHKGRSRGPQVRAYLNTDMSDRWIGRAGVRDRYFMTWPPRSPDMIACGFFIWGYLKDRVFVPPLPRDLEELKTRIREAAATVTEDMLKRVWEEFDYRLDICRVTRGSHIESL
ncbi:hypothetical protein ANN_02685 [Periplaneta americana]|uniref:Uncharacterized protein n=1 Tax=Periplaneta americana TaxID=6978 RepID=A0ABQ8TX10_PERAM|nr:hypothetical protein ANN_02685 [Periplaneta americana]